MAALIGADDVGAGATALGGGRHRHTRVYWIASDHVGSYDPEPCTPIRRPTNLDAYIAKQSVGGVELVGTRGCQSDDGGREGPAKARERGIELGAGGHIVDGGASESGCVQGPRCAGLCCVRRGGDVEG